MSTWNQDENCDKMFRIQDQGFSPVSESKERYNRMMLQYLEDKNTFKEDKEEQSPINAQKVKNWVTKWQNKDEIREEEADWISCFDTNKPAKVYANIKTHKASWP